MTANLSKIKAYVGFAIKSRQIVYGTDNILKTKKIKLVIVSDDLADNGYEKISLHAQKCGALVVKFSSDDIFEITGKSIKALAVMSESLADAIKKSLAI